MHFYIDESGHSGLKLFDASQPDLLYGMVSSQANLDIVAELHLRALRERFDVARLHASDLGLARLSEAALPLLKLVARYNIRFDHYRVVKADYALMQFFDQVFDQGLNPAVGWHWYWTPLRYILMLTVAELFDEPLVRKAWAARIDPNDVSSQRALVEVCAELKARATELEDPRARQLVVDALGWAIQNPGELQYNANRKDMRLAISPNLIGFQFVLMGAAERLRALGKRAQTITVDQQQEFNRAQDQLATFYSRAAGRVYPLGPGLPSMDLRHMPTQALRFRPSTESAGLELVDLFLWLVKKTADGVDLDDRLAQLVSKLIRRGRYDELSLTAIAQRWAPLFNGDLELSEEELQCGREFMRQAEEFRLEGMTSKPDAD